MRLGTLVTATACAVVPFFGGQTAAAAAAGPGGLRRTMVSGRQDGREGRDAVQDKDDDSRLPQENVAEELASALGIFHEDELGFESFDAAERDGKYPEDAARRGAVRRSLMSPTEASISPAPTEAPSVSSAPTGMMDHKMFSPLHDNVMADWESECSPENAISFKSLVENATAVSAEVKIDVGKCAVVDYVAGEHVEVPGGINIEGKLKFPRGASVTLRLPSVFVQGVLEVEQPVAGTPVPSTEKVKFIFYGTEDVMFTPHVDNMKACGGNMTHHEACDVGKKAFVIAGGRLDVRAIDPDCPSWERLIDSGSSIEPPTMPIPDPKPSPPAHCSRVILDLDYKMGDAFHNFGGSASLLPHDPTMASTGDPAYLKVTNRASYQGPKVHIPDKTCIVPDAPYLATGRARFVSNKPDGSPPNCSIEGGAAGNCLRFKAVEPMYDLGAMQNGNGRIINAGEWFEFAFNLNPLSSSRIDFAEMHYWFYNVEADVDIDLDWIRIELPSDDSFAEPDETGCLDLVSGNGDAESNGANTYPFTQSHGNNYLHIETETDPATNLTNSFFRQERFFKSWGMWNRNLQVGCFEPNVAYTVKMKWRFDSDSGSASQLKLRFGWAKPTGGWEYKSFGKCPLASRESGWVDCEVTFTSTEEMVGANAYELWTHPQNNPGSAPYPTIDYDDISVTRAAAPAAVPTDQITVSPAAASCWSAGSELVITSSTTSQDDDHLVTVASSDPATGTLTLAEPISYTTSTQDDAEFPVEVALLHRNFILEAEEEDESSGGNTLHGGHLIVLHTPNVSQVLEGVEIRNFGQQGNLGRYPVHFHMSMDVDGSLVSRNVVRGSNQRAIVIHGTNNATVADNVAYDIKGHAFFLEDGAEQFNRFLRNLGAGVRGVQTLVPSGSEESDGTPSVFWMSNPMNYWEGNVAAGSSHIGFWIEIKSGETVRGPSRDLHPDMNPQFLPLLLFKDNDVHSTSFCGWSAYPTQWRPPQEAQLINLRSYRNHQNGVLFHVNDNIRMVGGVVADNGVHQVWSQLADTISFNGTRVMGLRPEYSAALTRAGKTSSQCALGITFSPNRQFSGTRGSMLHDVHFSHFTCGKPAIGMDEKRTAGVTVGDITAIYNAVSMLNNVTFDNVTVKVDMCDAADNGVNDVAIEDIQGSLSPTGQAGFLVSNNDASMTLSGGECTPIEGSCLSYCDNVCLQTVLVYTNSVGEDHEMVVENDSMTAIVDRHGSRNIFAHSDAIYSMSLPAGTFNITFRNIAGATVYPDYVHHKPEQPPVCAKGETVINVIKPEPTSDLCDELIKTGDFEAGSIDGWSQFFTGLELTSPGEDSDFALRTMSRDLSNAMIAKWLNLVCLVEGAEYDVSLSYRLVHANGTALDCGSSCPQVSLAYYPGGQQKWLNVGSTDLPFIVGGWNTISGSFTVTETIANSDKVLITMFDSGQTFSGGQFIIDNFIVSQVHPAPP